MTSPLGALVFSGRASGLPPVLGTLGRSKAMLWLQCSTQEALRNASPVLSSSRILETSATGEDNLLKHKRPKSFRLFCEYLDLPLIR